MGTELPGKLRRGISRASGAVGSGDCLRKRQAPTKADEAAIEPICDQLSGEPEALDTPEARMEVETAEMTAASNP